MTAHTEHPPLLVFAYGNPSRGDDSLGPALHDLLDSDPLKNSILNKFELLIDFQLQIEHAVDLQQRDAVLFIDASVSCAEPYEFYRLQPKQDESYTTHAMSPSAVLAVYQEINPQPPPPAYMLTIRGYEFGLGQAMTEQAAENLQQGYEFTRKLLDTCIESW